MQEILIFGHVCIDHNTTEHGTYEGPGSPAMFMSRIFRQLPECTSAIVAPYGADFLPYRNTPMYPEEPLSIQTMRYENIITNGVRKQTCLYWKEAQPISIDTTIKNMIQNADIVCITPLAPNIPGSYIKQIKHHMKPSGTMLLLPQGYFRTIDDSHVVHVREFTEAPDILPITDIIIVSDEDHPDMIRVGVQWSTLYHCMVIVTQAEEGASLIEDGVITHIPTQPVPIQDIISSVGAGDIFSAGFVHQYIISHDSKRAIAFGNALARQCLLQKPDAILTI